MSDWYLFRQRRRFKRNSFSPTSAEIASSVDEFLKTGGEIIVLPRQKAVHSVLFDKGQPPVGNVKSRGFHE